MDPCIEISHRKNQQDATV